MIQPWIQPTRFRTISSCDDVTACAVVCDLTQTEWLLNLCMWAKGYKKSGDMTTKEILYTLSQW